MTNIIFKRMTILHNQWYLEVKLGDVMKEVGQTTVHRETAPEIVDQATQPVHADNAPKKHRSKRGAFLLGGVLLATAACGSEQDAVLVYPEIIPSTEVPSSPSPEPSAEPGAGGSKEILCDMAVATGAEPLIKDFLQTDKNYVECYPLGTVSGEGNFDAAWFANHRALYLTVMTADQELADELESHLDYHRWDLYTEGPTDDGAEFYEYHGGVDYDAVPVTGYIYDPYDGIMIKASFTDDRPHPGATYDELSIDLFNTIKPIAEAVMLDDRPPVNLG